MIENTLPPLAHAGDWIVALLFMTPVFVLGALFVIARRVNTLVASSQPGDIADPSIGDRVIDPRPVDEAERSPRIGAPERRLPEGKSDQL